MKAIKKYLLVLALAMLSFGAAEHAAAQTTPFCATSAAFVVFLSPTGAPLSSTTETRMGLRQGFGADTYNFIPENVVVNGFQVTLDARGMYVANTTFPVVFTSLGVLPAGSYSIVVRPIATNVTPNVVCATFVVPLVIPQGFVNVPVPSSSSSLLALLASALGAVGLLAFRRRSVV